MGAPPPAAPPPTASQPAEGGRSPRAIAAAVAVVAVLGLAGIFLAMTLLGGSNDAPLTGQPGAVPTDFVEEQTDAPTEPATAAPEPTDAVEPTDAPEPTEAATPKPTKRPTPKPTKRPTPKPTKRPTPPPTAPQGSRRAIEDELLARVSAIDCSRWRKSDQPFDFGARGAIRCARPAPLVSQLALFTFPEPSDHTDYWQIKLDSLTPPLAASQSACQGPATGIRTWDAGTLACYIEKGKAKLRWTDERTGLYGVLDATDQDAAALYGWWRKNGRRLGLPSGQTPGGGGGPALTIPPTLGDPGPPTALTCDVAPDISDEWGRSWRVTQVSFLNRNGYERVVLHLARTARGSGSAQVQTERIANASLSDQVPGAPEPSSGRWTVFVDLNDAIRDATGLTSYRPSGMSTVKELSMYRGSAFHAALVSVGGSGCFQVRVPAFGPAATGSEDKAEVYIDIEG